MNGGGSGTRGTMIFVIAGAHAQRYKELAREWAGLEFRGGMKMEVHAGGHSLIIGEGVKCREHELRD